MRTRRTKVKSAQRNLIKMIDVNQKIKLRSQRHNRVM
jgi:hypothetical protein